MRTVVYIDGFNLYYGALRGSRDKWLNLETYFCRLLPDDHVQQIKYFTAQVTGPAGARQAVYLQALATLPVVTTILGRFKDKSVRCGVPLCSFSGDRRFRTPEEKRTDVNIAVHLVDDAHRDDAEKFVIVSGDSDLVPAIQMIRLRFPQKRVVVYVPATDPVRGAAVELRNAAHVHRTLPNNLLSKSQFPAILPDGLGGAIYKPAGW